MILNYIRVNYVPYTYHHSHGGDISNETAFGMWVVLNVIWIILLLINIYTWYKNNKEARFWWNFEIFTVYSWLMFALWAIIGWYFLGFLIGKWLF